MIMRTLSGGLREQGHRVDWLVGRLHQKKVGPEISVFDHDSRRSLWSRFWISRSMWVQENFGGNRHGRGIARFLRNQVGQPLRNLRVFGGHEDFDFPDTLPAFIRHQPRPDVAHLHGLHSNYFDLRVLPELSSEMPIVVTLHDAWMVTGHCAYPGSCHGYRRGCGNCPDLQRFPAIRRDATRFNFQKKRDIYRRSRIHLVTPSQWLMDLVNATPMSDCFASKQVIPNGIDVERFHPGDRMAARRKLCLDLFQTILLFNAKNARTNTHKDFATAQSAAIKFAKENNHQSVLLMVLGENAEDEIIGNLKIRFTSVGAEDECLPDYYRAADVLIHTALCENFPTVVLEAMAAGIPVIASDTGGIREQVLSALPPNVRECENVAYLNEDRATGVLIRQGDDASAVAALRWILESEARRSLVGANGRGRAEKHFSSQQMVASYQNLYHNVVVASPVREHNR